MGLARQKPRVGDEIIPGPGQANQPLQGYRLYLAIRLGESLAGDGGESWLAWNDSDGTLESVDVGHYWVVKPSSY